ncbi:hypothetical protein LBO01_04370 [Companilactobacillus paralimentarius]|nr:hypothetical protein LBO01_04370 [Companilactobacillus paralimentarius]
MIKCNVFHEETSLSNNRYYVNYRTAVMFYIKIPTNIRSKLVGILLSIILGILMFLPNQ